MKVDGDDIAGQNIAAFFFYGRDNVQIVGDYNITSPFLFLTLYHAIYKNLAILCPAILFHR